MHRRAIAMVAVVGVGMTACMSREIVDVREHVFLSQPLWESSIVRPESPSVAVAVSTVSESIDLLTKERPGLSLIVRQVFRDEIAASQKAKGVPVGAGAVDVLASKGTKHLRGEETPLPSEVAVLPVMKVIAGTMWQQTVASRGVKVSAGSVPDTMPKKLSLADFRRFGDAVAANLVRPYQDVGGVQTSSLGGAGDCKDKKITLRCLYTAYMIAYFNGSFVDRNGGVYSKPKASLTITNETISSVVAIFLEALFDYSIIDGVGGKAPIVYIEDKTSTPSRAKWLIKGDKAPTLVEVAIGLKAYDPSNPNIPVMENVFEDASKGGMDAKRLCIVRMLGGAAGDAAQPVTGVIVRAFGGANLGFSFGLGALGKVSFGDNETLAKLVDTVVENFSRRSTEIAMENILYGSGPPKSEALKAALEIAGWVSDCK